MASGSGDGVERLKDILLEHVLRDVKGLQNSQIQREKMDDVVNLTNSHVQALCEHLDRILMHGLRNSEMGYWAPASYFTRSEAVTMISSLQSVKTNVGRGRVWLYLALNEQSLESYVRMFLENQDVIQNYYLRDSFVRDLERLVVLQTLMAALDFISFDLPIESIYLDYGATKATSTVGTLQHNITPDVDPTFHSRLPSSSKPVEPAPPSTTPSSSSSSSKAAQAGTSPKSGDGFSLTGMISNVFGKDKKNSPVTADREIREAKAGTPVSHSPSEAGKGGAEGMVSSLEVESDELRSSLSPHRTLAQPDLQGLARVESDSNANSPHSSLRLARPSLETHLSMEGGGDEEEELVLRPSKSKSSKSKTKKKKKKKKEKSKANSEGAAKTELSEDQGRVQPDASEVRRSEEDLSTSQPGISIAQPDDEPDGVSEVPLTSTPGGSGGGSGQEGSPGGEVGRGQGEESADLARQAEVSSPEAGDMSYEQWRNTVDADAGGREDHSPSLPQREPGHYREEVEEFDSGGFGGEGHPLPSPPQPLAQSQPEGVKKRLSLAEEMEMVGEQAASSLPSRDGNWGEGRVVTPPPEPALQSERPVPTFGGEEEEEEEVPVGHMGEEEEELAPDSETLRYDGSPVRPSEITEQDKRASDIEIDDTTRIVISLDILHQEEEELHRLVQLATPTGVGQQRTCYVLITSHCTYILRKDGIEGNYSRELAIKYKDYDHIVIGLGWQSLHLMYRDEEGGALLREYILLTGSEAVSRGLVDSVRTLAASCPGFMRSVPLNKDDESRVNAIEKELIKLGSETSMDIMQYLLVNWEQLSGEGPADPSLGASVGVARSGYLMVKTTNLLGIATWRQAYFTVKDGVLRQFASEEDDTPKTIFQIRNCGGCLRAPSESKPFALSILGKDQSVMVVVAASDEEELTRWMQTLCEAVIEKEMPGSPTIRKACFFCALLLTQNKIHVLQEDWTNKTVQLVTSCAVTDVNDISVDKSLPYYCTISYDHENDQGVWLVCFNTEYELGKFEAALAGMWREEFQIDLRFSEVSDMATRHRAHRAVELMQGSKYRSDSMTRGRTEFTYSGRY